MHVLVPTTILTCLLAVFLGVITQSRHPYHVCIDKCADKPGVNESTCGTISRTKGGKSFVRLRNECEVTCMNYTVEPLVVCCPPPFYGANCTWIWTKNSTMPPKKKN